MKNCNTNEQRTIRRSLLIAYVTTLGVVFTVALPHAAHIDVQPQAAHADDISVPPVPADIQVPAPHEVVLVGHAVGTQNYICLPSGSSVAWTLFTPQATLFRKRGQQLQTHFFSPNPVENGTVRAAWQHSRDSSTVWGRVSQSSSDPTGRDPVAPGGEGWSPRRTSGRRSDDGNHLHSTAEYHWRGGAHDGPWAGNRHRQQGVRALQGRLLLLREPQPPRAER